MASEARVHPRLRIDANGDIIGHEVILGRRIEDISLGGCRFSGPAWEESGTEVQMVLCFPSLGANLPVQGVVVRSTDTDMGVRFDGLSDEQKWALRKHLREVQGKAS